MLLLMYKNPLLENMAAPTDPLVTEGASRFQTVPLDPAYATELTKGMSAREREVIGLVALGLTNQVIGNEIFVTESTVKTHLSSAGKRANISSRRALRSIAYASGLVLEAAERDQPSPIKDVLERNELGTEEVQTMSAHDLTIRDFQFLTLTAKGWYVSQIAPEFSIMESSLKSHVATLHKKLGVHSSKQALEKVGITSK
jgi:DNA-binding NarL/FixJ family response regulator